MTHDLFLVSAAFLACAVEMVEALTIVLAVGVTRGWRSAIIGTATALGALTVVFIAAHHGADWWWLLPLAVAALLTVSVTHAARHRSP